MVPETRNLFEIISQEYYSFTASEKKLADFILANQDGIAYLTISQLADSAGVAEATVSRFCRHLDFKGYVDFKLTAANTAFRFKPTNNPLSGQVADEDSVEDICRKLYTVETEAIAQTMELLNPKAVTQAANLLEKASRVLCMGQGGSMLLAQEASHLFSTVSNKFCPISDSHLQAMAASMMDPEDIIFFFSYSGSTKAMIETLGLAKKRKAKIILVTRFPNSPGAELADVVLQCGANENPLQSGSVAARIAQMYLLDVLFSEYARRNIAWIRTNRARIAEALSGKHL